MTKEFVSTYHSKYHNLADILRDEMHQFERLVFDMENHMPQRYAFESSIRMMNACIICDELTGKILPVNAMIGNAYAVDIYLHYMRDWRFSFFMNLETDGNGPTEVANLDTWIVHTAFAIALVKGIHHGHGGLQST